MEKKFVGFFFFLLSYKQQSPLLGPPNALGSIPLFCCLSPQKTSVSDPRRIKWGRVLNLLVTKKERQQTRDSEEGERGGFVIGIPHDITSNRGDPGAKCIHPLWIHRVQSSSMNSSMRGEQPVESGEKARRETRHRGSSEVREQKDGEKNA